MKPKSSPASRYLLFSLLVCFSILVPLWLHNSIIGMLASAAQHQGHFYSTSTTVPPPVEVEVDEVTKTPPTSAVGDDDEFANGIDKNNASGVSKITSVGNGKFETFLECHLALEKWLNPLIDTWLLDEVPLLDNVITIDGMYHIFLNVRMLAATAAGPHPFLEATWFCNHNETAKMLPIGRKSSGLMILTCNSSSPISTVWPSAVVSNKTGETPYYDVRPHLACDELDRRAEDVPSPAAHGTKIGACTLFRGDFGRQVMEQWIEYHRLIGVHHFWIYINEPTDNLRDLPQRPYVTYVPYDYQWEAHRGSTKYRSKRMWQESMQMQCIYRAKRDKLDWVTTTDLDEYIRVMSPPNSTTTNNSAVSPLQHLLDGIPNQHEIGGLVINNVPFGRNILLEPSDNHKTSNNNTAALLVMDHVWRNKQDLEKASWRRFKMIYKPQNAWDVGVHYLFRGGRKRRLNVTSQAFLQHYKLADLGVHGSNPNDVVIDTDLRDQYRDRVLAAMNSIHK
jgi:hypothetical protein